MLSVYFIHILLWKRKLIVRLHQAFCSCTFILSVLILSVSIKYQFYFLDLLAVAFRLYDLRQTGYIEREEVSILACPGHEDVTGLNIYLLS